MMPRWVDGRQISDSYSDSNRDQSEVRIVREKGRIIDLTDAGRAFAGEALRSLPRRTHDLPGSCRS
jgi:hypothetical protein